MPLVGYKIKDTVCELTLHDPPSCNALSRAVIEQLHTRLEQAEQQTGVRCILIQSMGPHFSSGAHLKEMREMLQQSEEANQQHALLLAQLLQRLNGCSKPLLALVQGRALGGALGILACCDVVIAEENASFCFSELKLGLIPATIAPYVVRCMGWATTRHLWLTAQPFSAAAAQQYHLVHQICAPGQLRSAATAVIAAIQHNGPEAIAASKALLNTLQPIEEPVVHLTAETLAHIRVSQEAQEGMAAFFEKRKPAWCR